jgi:hypothetical protein
MTTADIIRNRLINQQLAFPLFEQPHQVVQSLGAMQAQEFAMAKWAIGLRLTGFNDTMIDKAFNEGTILRTHLLRPTWHFVAPEDIRWILALTAPRIHALNAYYYRQSELDAAVLKKTNALLIKMLEGGRQLTRTALQAGLEQKKIKAAGLRLGLIMMKAELDGIICSGSRQGKQFTYALLDERVPPVKKMHRDEALAMLCLRYFSTRGPATLQDFTVWSGLSMKDAREGAATLPSSFIREIFQEKEYIFKPTALKANNKGQSTFLMPDYDEYGMGYKDRSAIFIPKTNWIDKPRSDHMIVINGKVAGSWQRTIKKNKVTVEATPFIPLSTSKRNELSRAIKKYETFFSTKS